MKTYLRDLFFTEKETVLVENGELKATLFRYSTGIAAVRISNSKGSATVLPFVGQAVWRCDFLGRELTMKSIYDEPQECSVYGETYGFFIMHCGLTAMGNPTPADTHPGHGELPLARYGQAWVETGTDGKGPWIAVGGVYSHLRCFEVNYDFRPSLRLHAGGTSLEIDVSFTNRKDLPLEYYYLCHINHRPVDGSRLFYTADRRKAIVNREVPEGYRRDWAAATNAWLDAFERDPSCGDVIGAPGESYRPEIVNCFMHHAAKDGWAYTMQRHPDGTAVYVKHDPRQLPYGTRWIARTVDEDALGMCLPATAEHKGRIYCREHGQQRVLKTGGTVRYHMETGFLTRAAASAMRRLISACVCALLSFAAAFADEGFSKDALRDPPPVFAPSFFWMWSGKISSASQMAEMEDMAAHGAGTACIHPYPKRFRPTQIDDPMEPDFLTDGYFRIYGDVLGLLERMGGVAWLYDEGGWPSGGACGRVMESDPVRFQHRYLAAGGRIETWRGDPKVESPHPSVIEPGATERFLELAYEPYRRRFARHFGKTIRFAFTDEPAFPNRRSRGRLPWCSDFAEEFRSRKGYDILPFCDELIAATNRSEDVVRAQIDYRDVLADIFRERYLLPVRSWCRANGLKFGGHFGGEDDPRGNLQQGFGHILRSLRTLDVPGVDVIWRQLFPGKGGRGAPFTKYASSAAHQNGAEYVLSETFAIYGDGLTPSQIKWLVDYQMLRGVNLFVFSSYRACPEGKEMAGGGPHFGPSDPQWDCMATYFRSVRRQCALLSQGSPCVPTAVLFDVRGIWAGGDEMEHVAQRHEAVAQRMFEEQRDFDFVDDDQLAAADVGEGGTLTVGRMRYSAVVLPTSRRMRPEARAKLDEFARRGGRVIEGDDLSAAPKVCEVSGAGAADIRAVKRTCGGESLYFLVNESEERRSVTVRLGESRRFVRADPDSGRFVEWPSDGGTFRWDADGCGSLILVSGIGADEPAPPARYGGTIALAEGWTMAVRRRLQVGPARYETAEYPDAPRFAAALGDWRGILGDGFSGRVSYLVRFGSPSAGAAELDLGEVHNCCEVRLNGKLVGAKYVGPYRWRVELREGENELEVTVANALVNAVGSPRVRKYIYSAFPPESVYERRVKDFNGSGHESGLYGPVVLRLIP